MLKPWSIPDFPDFLRQISNQNWRRLTAELRYYATTRRGAPLTLADFVRDQCLDLEDLYDGKPGWTALCRAAGLEQSAPDPDETYLGKHLGALLHVDDPEHLQFLRRVAEDPAALLAQCAHLAQAEQRRIQMLAYQVFSDRSALMDAPAFLARMAANPAICRELAQLATCLYERADLDPQSLPSAPADWPPTRSAKSSPPSAGSPPNGAPPSRPACWRAPNTRPNFCSSHSTSATGSMNASPTTTTRSARSSSIGSRRTRQGRIRRPGVAIASRQGMVGSSSSSCGRRAGRRIGRWDRSRWSAAREIGQCRLRGGWNGRCQQSYSDDIASCGHEIGVGGTPPAGARIPMAAVHVIRDCRA